MAQWRQRRLGDVLEIKHGFAFKGEFFSNTGEFVLLTPGNFREEGGLRLKGEKEKHYTGEFPEKFLLRQGDLLVAMTDLTQNAPILGSTAFIPEDGRFLHNQRLGKIVNLETNEVLPEFVFYLFNTASVRGHIKGSASGATVRHTSPSRIYDVPVELPLLPVQRRIVGILSAYDELIENNHRRIQILETMARALYREWFVAFRFPDHENALRMLCFGDLCDLIKQPFINQTHINLPLLDLSRMPQRSLAPSETGKPNELTTSRIVFKSGDTLFGAIRCYLHKVVAVHYPGVTNTSVLVLRPKQANFRSLVALIASDTETIRWAESHSNGTKMPVINWSVFRAMPSAWPSESLAQRFESIAGPMLDEIGVLADQIQNLRLTRDLLLPRLLSGQLALTDTAA